MTTPNATPAPPFHPLACHRCPWARLVDLPTPDPKVITRKVACEAPWEVKATLRLGQFCWSQIPFLDPEDAEEWLECPLLGLLRRR